MIRTPPLTTRVTRLGTAVVAVTLAVVNVVVLLVLSRGLERSVDELLDERVGAVQAEASAVARDGGGAAELADRLQARGLRVTVSDPDGTTFSADPTSPYVGRGLPDPGAQDEYRTRDVALAGGLTAEVAVSTTGVGNTLRGLVLIQALTSLGGLGLAALLLRAASRRAMRPVTEIAAAASRTAQGAVGQRLRPDDPTTELGRMATEYDAMVDALETSLAEVQRAHAERSLLAAVVEGSTDAIWVQDLDGTMLTWNTAGERLLGWTADEVVGRDVSLMVPEHELEKLSTLVDEVREAGEVRGYEGERTARNGQVLPVSVRLSPVRDDDGRIVGVAAGARDVTEQRWMAATLNSTLAALQDSVAEARASEDAARRFLADAAHQLRTPMTGIRACAEALLQGTSGEDADRLMATMVRETSRAARLIASLLRMARLDQGLALEAGPVDLRALCADEVERLGLLAPELDVRLDDPGAMTAAVVANGPGSQEILSNLGDNARRHARTSVRLSLAQNGSHVEVRLADDGAGVPPEARERVFERFVSLDGGSGSGLGLPIARGLARAMGGDVRCDDDGFVLSLPVQDDERGPGA